MIEFKDGCTPLFFKFLRRKGFYEYRAYFLAAAGIAEYKDCDSAKQIVEQIIKWSYLDRDIIDEVSSYQGSSGYLVISQAYVTSGKGFSPYSENKVYPEIQFQPQTQKNPYQFEDWQTREHGARAALKEMKFTEEIKQLLIDQFLKLLESTKDFQLVEGLGEVAIGDSNAITTLEQLLASTEDEETCRYLAYNLGKIHPGNSTAISTFLRVLESARDKFNFQNQWVILKQIGEIANGNPNVSAVLEQIINDKGQELIKIKGVARELIKIKGVARELIKTKDDEQELIKYTHTNLKGINSKPIEDFGSLKSYFLKQKIKKAFDNLSDIFFWDSRILFGAISSLIKIDPENLTVPQTVVSYLLLFEGFFFESRSLFKHEFKVTTVGNIEKPFIIIEDPFISQEIINLLKNSFIRTTVVVSLEQLLASTEDEDTRLEVVYHLGEIDPGNSTAISNLMQLLESTQSHIQRQALNRLDKIGVGNPNAIAVLQQLLASTDDENMRLDVTDSLGKIDPSNSTAISMLIQLLESTKSKHTHLRIVGYLGEIAISDPNAIAALEKLLSSTEDEDICGSSGYLVISQAYVTSGKGFSPYGENKVYPEIQFQPQTQKNHICLEVAYQLGKIDPGNSTSISALVQLLESTEDDFKFEDITERLVEIGGGNLVAIAALEKLLKSPKDLLMRSIKHEYKEANEMFFEDDWIDLERKLSKFLPAEIAELPVQIAAILDVDIIKSAKDAYFNMRWQAACALGKIDPGNKTATTVLLQLIKPFVAAREEGAIVEGLTGIGNLTAITFLVELIRSTKNPEILQDAAEGLIESLSED
jgi:HEAT repeat protein